MVRSRGQITKLQSSRQIRQWVIGGFGAITRADHIAPFFQGDHKGREIPRQIIWHAIFPGRPQGSALPYTGRGNNPAGQMARIKWYSLAPLRMTRYCPSIKSERPIIARTSVTRRLLT